MSTATATGGVLARLGSADLAAVDAAGPGWLVASRHAAMARVAARGFPTRKDEDWRYTKLDPILDVAYERAAAGHNVDRARIAQLPDFGGPLLVFVNGCYDATLSSVPQLPAGVTVSSLSDALANQRELLEPILTGESSSGHAFAAANAALAADGAFVHLATGTSLPEPIHLLFVSDTGGARLLSSPRSIVLLDRGSEACVVETHVGSAGDVHCTNAVTDIRLAEDARLKHFKLEDEPDTASHLALTEVHQQRGSNFASYLSMLGGRIARQEVRVHLVGEGAEVSLDGLYVPRGDQVHDNTIFIEHVAPGCSSHQLYKSALSGRSRGIFNGHVLVRPGADGTDAHQTNKNLVLADRAEADTRPRLEIYADDVKCTHGAAVGQLDQQAVLYLRSRGIGEREARHLLVDAFVGEMVERIELVPLREQVRELLAERSFDE